MKDAPKSAPEVGRRHDTSKGRNAREVLLHVGESLAVELHQAREVHKRSISAMLSDAWRAWRPDSYTTDDLPSELCEPLDYRISTLIPREDAHELEAVRTKTKAPLAYLLRRAWVEVGRTLYPLPSNPPPIDLATLRRTPKASDAKASAKPEPQPELQAQPITIHPSPTTEAQMRGIKSDAWIRRMANGASKMIEPFESGQVREVDGKKVISYGTSSYGYDVRCADEFKVFTNLHSTIVDPKNFDAESFVDVSGKGYVIIPPNSFALARTVEYLRIPRNVLVLCLGKSTYARCGIIVNVTPLEPEWEGHVTLEFSNTTPLPAKIYAHEGVAQFVFFEGEECQTSYRDRGGKYQGQRGVTPPRL